MQSVRSRRPASRALRFAPISDEPSTGLRLASGYFLPTVLLGSVPSALSIATMVVGIAIVVGARGELR